ncbi:tetratricopeptide repeat protein [Campylobacter majalis]|uniref:tetratricopeptide repeat protein n=1 Tax=Campylobacter majalis TaxID=2790656 RepID=UPI003D69A7E3
MADDEVILKPAGEEEKPDEIVSIEELPSNDNAQSEQIDDEEISPQNTKKSKKRLLIIIAAVVAVIIVVLIVLILVLKSGKKSQDIGNDLARRIEQSYPTQEFLASRVDEMINKANQLYERGDKFQALKIYESIATHSQSLSNYNLGVSQMKQGNCVEAVDSFAKAISNKENGAVSAINAAICSLDLNNTKNFNYYIELANTFLPDEADSPLYSYYYALINYYKGNYTQALHALNHPSSQHYKDKYLYLSGKILTSLGRDSEAIVKLEAQREFDANFTLAQLYARIADYSRARDYLQRAAKNTTNPDLIKMTAGMIDLKTSYYGDAGAFIAEVFKQDPLIPSKIYRLKTVLNPEIFDVNIAQMRFNNDMFFDKIRRYETLFYFAPYKVFNAAQAMSQIRKGGMSVFLDDTSGADAFLRNSSALSSVNARLTHATAKALNYELKAANAEFATLVRDYPEHSILHYNLALTYAQLGNFTMSAKHFATSYHLDPTNYLAGVFHAISTDITGNLNPKFVADISESLGLDTSIKTPNLYNSLLDLISQNNSSLIRYLEEPSDDGILSIAYQTIIAKALSQNSKMKELSATLVQKLPDDIVANVLNFIANDNSNDVKTYALNVQKYFKSLDLNEDSFYNGANIVKKQYVKLLQISGLLYYERDKLRNALLSAPANINLLQTLAYIELFTNDFKHSYEIYNRLIDEYKQDDAVTLFLASVAAIGAGDVPSAIALLELTRVSDENAIENRIALGYLYHEIDNIEAAVIQYNKVGNTDFKPEFYDFILR